MNQNRKYFGMTTMQLGILAGLAAIVFLLFCTVGWLILGRMRGARSSRSDQTIVTPQPTATLNLPSTMTSTPASTPIPYETLIPAGWVQFRTTLYEIWLPAGYKSAKAEALVTGLGGDPIVDLSLRGATSSKSPNKIYVTVSYEPLTAGTFEDFINQKLTTVGLSPSERNKVTLNTVPALRIVFSGRKGNNSDINELTYVIQDGTTVWYVQYTAEITEFYNLLADFESSARTFRVLK